MRLSILLAVLGGIAVCPKFVNGETCPNIDGTAIIDINFKSGCLCGSTYCYKGGKCTASSSTCVFETCPNIDGTQPFGGFHDAYGDGIMRCQCGTSFCDGYRALYEH